MTVSIWQSNEKLPIEHVDFLIIGAGIAGCTAAYFAQQNGQTVVITDKADVAMGASGRNAGFLITGLDTYYHRAIERYGQAVTREMWKLSEETHSYWHQFIQQSPESVRIEKTGSLLLAESPEEAKELELAAKALDKEDIPHVFWDSDPLNRGYYAAIEQPEDAAVQPYELVQSILKQSKATLIHNNETYAIEQTASDCVTVTTQHFIFKAKHVLLCTNAYSSLLDAYFADKVIPTRAQCLVTEPLETSVMPTCGYSNYGYMYYRMTFDNRLLIGGARHNDREAEANTFEDRTTHSIQNALEAYLHERFPEVTAKIDRRWAGIMGFSVDGLPLVGRLPHKPSVGFAVGFTGHGLALSAGVVERAVNMLLHNSSVGAVSAERFH